MRATRFVVNVLGALTGLVGLAWALVAPATYLILLSGYWPGRSLEHTPERLTVIITALTLILTTFGAVMLRQVWKHARQPDRATARGITCCASFILGLFAFRLALDHQLVPDAAGALKPVREITAIVLALVGCYLIYRLALRPLADHAFPSSLPQPGVH